MNTHAVKLRVEAKMPKDCIFWLEADGWTGICEELSVQLKAAVLRTWKGQWKRHYRSTSRLFCVKIPRQVRSRLREVIRYQNPPHFNNVRQALLQLRVLRLGLLQHGDVGFRYFPYGVRD